MASSSTNNLEKAYEDLEREILEIKMKLQGSSIGPGGQNYQHQQMSLEEQTRMGRSGDPEFNREATLAQSMGSVGRTRDNHSSQMATGTFQPAQSMSA